MVLRSENGKPYRLSGAYRQFNPNDPKCQLFNSWDQEIIRIGGSPIFYYEVLIQFSNLDQLYLEDRGQLFALQPIQLYAFYEPVNQAVSSGLFGGDALPDEVVFEGNYDDIYGRIGHLPKVGSRIYTPHLGENWKVVDRASSEYRGWGRLRMQIRCQKFQETRTVSNGQVTKQPPDFPII